MLKEYPEKTSFFTWGKIHTSGDWLINGKDTSFDYKSDHGLTVSKNSTIHLKQTTFNYDASSSNLIQMTDQTSQIHLDRSTLMATQNCNLSNGTLLTTGFGTLYGNATLNIHNIGGLDIVGSLLRIGNVIL